MKYDHLKVSPVSKVQGRTHSKAETTVYDVQQVQRLIAECDHRSRLYWSLAVFAGVRPLELTRLDPKDVSINHRRIVIKSSVSKTKTPRVIDMSDNLASLLEPLLGKVPIHLHANASKILEKPKRAAGLIGFGSHTDSHSYASYHLAAHNNMGLLMKNMGHFTNIITLKHYYNLVMIEDAEDFWNIGL